MTDDDTPVADGSGELEETAPKRSKRFEALDERAVTEDGFVNEWPEVGFVAMESPNDPDPSITVEDGEIVEMDGKDRAEFDFIDRFIADYAINVEKAEEAMATDSEQVARDLVDINVPREDIVELTTAMTPAKLSEVVNHLDTAEIIMAMKKMRTRRTPGNQCHVTSVEDNVAQIAADAAEAALRGFFEIENTVGVARMAPLTALAQQIGAQCGRGGVITQCAVEEATELELGMRGMTGYAETVSVYGTEDVFKDGDDTPWSKAFLASGYASRGLKMRYTSGAGSELNMGQAEGKSMLYLESRCILVTKGCGVQGLQNGGISCIAIPTSVPAGVKEVAAENLITMMADLEVASGNDQTFTHSDKRRTARMMPQFLAGTDFIFSGYSAVPNYDNMFAGSTFDSYDFDEYNIMQRDLQVEGGTKPVDEETVLEYRERAAKAVQSVFEELGFPPISDEEVEAAVYANGSKDMPERSTAEDIKAAEEMMEEGLNGAELVKILADNGFEEIAENLLGILKGRVAGDYIQTSGIFEGDGDFDVVSAVNDPNDYQGPGTGHRLEGEDWEEKKEVRFAVDPEDI
ncbi:propanediol/glycerol family dehydratase large subunit [Haloarcula sp. 1CSR25-25]|uniref:propanediol/glycerol family dehydratase large subunit n=1 Tax=Haloarcula sp. 1CSR25-25 TaxID=2862545 RepID=UPI002896245B|nr:propanediol/glycerol family dehydratase large subunit [Haloarcula sp. 1CSR25-25]MDT3433321.1 propanediol/glycerol family dehydratase large subunit [Haloarcula sp. 1CSR25-25]